MICIIIALESHLTEQYLKSLWCQCGICQLNIYVYRLRYTSPVDCIFGRQISDWRPWNPKNSIAQDLSSFISFPVSWIFPVFVYFFGGTYCSWVLPWGIGGGLIWKSLSGTYLLFQISGDMPGGTKFWVRGKNPEYFERRKRLFHLTLAGKKEIWP